MQETIDFYKGKKVLITGHTGFKGSWMCKILLMLGADIYGYSLAERPQQNLFEISGIDACIVCNKIFIMR